MAHNPGPQFRVKKSKLRAIVFKPISIPHVRVGPHIGVCSPHVRVRFPHVGVSK